MHLVYRRVWYSPYYSFKNLIKLYMSSFFTIQNPVGELYIDTIFTKFSSDI